MSSDSIGVTGGAHAEINCHVWHQYLNVFLICCSISELFHTQRITKHWHTLHKKSFNWARKTLCITIKSLVDFQRTWEDKLNWSRGCTCVSPVVIFIWKQLRRQSCFLVYRKKIKKFNMWCKVHLKGDLQIMRYDRPKAH